MRNARVASAAATLVLIAAALTVRAQDLPDTPWEFHGFSDKNENSIPDACDQPSHQFGLKTWPVSPQGHLMPKGRAPKDTEDRLLFCCVDSSYWATLIVAHEFAPRSARPRFVLYDLAHAQLDTMLTNIMSSTTIQAAGPVRYLKPPIVLAATVEGETLYAYVKH